MIFSNLLKVEHILATEHWKDYQVSFSRFGKGVNTDLMVKCKHEGHEFIVRCKSGEILDNREKYPRLYKQYIDSRGLFRDAG